METRENKFLNSRETVQTQVQFHHQFYFTSLFINFKVCFFDICCYQKLVLLKNNLNQSHRGLQYSVYVNNLSTKGFIHLLLEFLVDSLLLYDRSKLLLIELIEKSSGFLSSKATPCKVFFFFFNFIIKKQRKIPNSSDFSEKLRGTRLTKFDSYFKN